QALRDHGGVHGAGAGGGDAVDEEAVVRQQSVEHAPGEGAMRAPALQREIDRLAMFAAAASASLLARAHRGRSMRAGGRPRAWRSQIAVKAASSLRAAAAPLKRSPVARACCSRVRRSARAERSIASRRAVSK